MDHQSKIIMVPPEERGLCRRVCVGIIYAAFAVAVVATITGVVVLQPKKARYYASMDAVSGLDPATDLGGPSLAKVEFAVALRVKSAHPFDIACLNPNATVAVAYRGVTLASGGNSSSNVCPDKRFSLVASTTIVVRGAAGVVLPGSVLDSLASDMRRGAEAFDVEIWVPELWTGTGDGKVVSCTGVPGTPTPTINAGWTPCVWSSSR